MSTKDSGKMILEVVVAWSATQMVIGMRASFSMESHMVRVYTRGPTAKFTKVSGLLDLRRVKVFGKEFSVTAT